MNEVKDIRREVNECITQIRNSLNKLVFDLQSLRILLNEILK